MSVSARICLVALATACVETTPSGAVLAPVRETVTPEPAPTAAAATSAATPAEPTEPQGDFDFEAEDREEPAEAAAPAPLDPNALQAKATNIEPGPVPAEVWDPTQPPPGMSFGVRLLAVILDVQPPRAVIGLPDGREEVVQPGALLPEIGLVVLAIGRDAVQVAHVTPQGFYAKVETETIRALYPSATTTP
jgi:hypothetical protein